MQRNIGKTERILRLLLGVVICVSMLLMGNTTWRQHLARNWCVSLLNASRRYLSGGGWCQQSGDPDLRPRMGDDERV